MAETAQRNMAFGKVNAFIIAVHNKHPPTDEEWSEYLQSVYVLGLDHGTVVRYLIITEGGAPNLAQQKAVNDLILSVRQRHPDAFRAAVVTSSTFIHGIVSAFRVAHPFYRAFPPDDVHGAYEFLGVPPTYFAEIEALVASLKAKLRP